MDSLTRVSLTPVSADLPAILRETLRDPRVTDVFFSAEGIALDRGEGVERTDRLPPDEAVLRNWIVQLLQSRGKAFDAKIPYVDFLFELEGVAIRGHALFPPCVPRLEVSLRILRTPALDLGWETDPLFAPLQNRFRAGGTVILCGSTGSGKTTLARTLLAGLPARERVIALEDTPELNAPHPGFLSLRTREANADGYGEVRLKDLLRQTLRMRPDRIVLGECRGDEVLELLQVLNTGHAGSIATLHANSCREALKRIELLVLMHPRGGSMSLRAIRELILSGVQWIAHLKRGEDGKRRISEVTEIAGIEGETLLLRGIRPG